MTHPVFSTEKTDSVCGPTFLDTLVKHHIDDENVFLTGHLLKYLIFSEDQFDTLWNRHPSDYHLIRMPSGLVHTPRWQQAYGADYHYTGRTNKALPIPPELDTLAAWVKQTIDYRLNGLLCNWYDGKLEHYIGAHHDSTVHMIKGTSIVTISFGEDRIFRLTKWIGKGRQKVIAARRDFTASPGSLFITPYETNLTWKHEVPHFSRYRGRRISITFRAFCEGATD